MGAGVQHGTRAQASKCARVAAFAHHGAFEVTVGLDHHACAQGAVFDHTVRADDHVVLNDDLAFEDNVDVDDHIAADADFTAHIETGQIGRASCRERVCQYV